jgi:peptide-methionine (S)-S-oxide reductase
MRAGIGSAALLAGALGLVGLATVAADRGTEGTPVAKAAPGGAATAIFASGCFWCTESDFEKLPGVIEAVSGYIGGLVANPSYQQVSSGVTGHAEAVRLIYDPAKVSYEKLLEHYWKNVDPTVKDRQFCDTGSAYRSAIFVIDEAQRRAAEASRDAIAKTGRFARIYTEIVPATTFYVAEDYHQDFYKKNPIRYQYYRTGCGRDARLAELWGTK